MDWLRQLKDKVLPGGRDDNGDFQSRERRNARLPSTILALCSVRNDTAYSVTISDLGVTGVRIDSPRSIPRGSVVDIRVPVGVNFENRDTQEFVAFEGTSMWSRRRDASTYQVGVRYNEGQNEKRDRWIALVLETYGFSMQESAKRGEIRWAADFPVKATVNGDTVLRGRVMNISMGGMLAVLKGSEPPLDAAVALELGPIVDTPLLHVSGRIVRSRPEHMEDTWLTGIAFDPINEEQRTLLVRCLAMLSRT